MREYVGAAHAGAERAFEFGRIINVQRTRAVVGDEIGDVDHRADAALTRAAWLLF